MHYRAPGPYLLCESKEPDAVAYHSQLLLIQVATTANS